MGVFYIVDRKFQDDLKTPLVAKYSLLINQLHSFTMKTTLLLIFAFATLGKKIRNPDANQLLIKLILSCVCHKT